MSSCTSRNEGTSRAQRLSAHRRHGQGAQDRVRRAATRRGRGGVRRLHRHFEVDRQGQRLQLPAAGLLQLAPCGCGVRQGRVFIGVLAAQTAITAGKTLKGRSCCVCVLHADGSLCVVWTAEAKTSPERPTTLTCQGRIGVNSVAAAAAAAAVFIFSAILVAKPASNSAKAVEEVSSAAADTRRPF